MKSRGYYGAHLTMLHDPAELLRDHPRLLVKRVLIRDDDLTEALLDLAAGNQTNWTDQQWRTLLTELENCGDTIEDWLVLNS